MRILLTLIALLIASPAFSLSDGLINFCKTEPNPMQCIQQLMAQEQRFREEERAYLDSQLGIAQEQARGMALFGAGNAMINGMNQGFNNMRVQPAPIPFQPMPMPFPNAGGR